MYIRDAYKKKGDKKYSCLALPPIDSFGGRKRTSPEDNPYAGKCGCAKGTMAAPGRGVRGVVCLEVWNT